MASEPQKPVSDTPLTDLKYADLADEDCNCAWTSFECMTNHAKQLERENAKLREVINDLSGYVSHTADCRASTTDPMNSRCNCGLRYSWIERDKALSTNPTEGESK